MISTLPRTTSRRQALIEDTVQLAKDTAALCNQADPSTIRRVELFVVVKLPSAIDDTQATRRQSIGSFVVVLPGDAFLTPNGELIVKQEDDYATHAIASQPDSRVTALYDALTVLQSTAARSQATKKG